MSIITIMVCCVVCVYNNGVIPLNNLKNASKPVHDQIAEFLIQEEYDSVIGTHAHATKVSGYSNLALTTIKTSTGSFTPRFWLTDTRVFYDEHHAGKYAFVISDEELTNFEEHAPKQDRDILAQAQQVAQFNNIKVFELGFNPVRFYKFPVKKGEENYYDFTKLYVEKRDEVIINYDDMYIEFNDINGNMIWGPYAKTTKGAYEIIINYEYTNYNGDCAVRLSQNSSGSVFADEPLPNGNGKMSHSFTMELGIAVERMEIVVYNNHSSGIKLYNAIIKRL